MPSKKLWRKSLGERGLRVYLFERTPGGALYREVYIDGKRVPKRSLGHRDKDRAEAEAYKLLAKLRAFEEASNGGKLALSMLFDNYIVSPAHRQKKQRTQQNDESLLTALIDQVGPSREVRSLSPSDASRYVEARMAGELGSRAVGPRTAAKGLVALRTMLNWATRERDSRGNALLERKPLAGGKIPVEKNPLRPVETYDSYLQLMEVAKEANWRLPLALCLAESTGQRIGSILQLRVGDIDLHRLPHGQICFRGETQKTGYDHGVPMTDYARGAVLQHLGRLGADARGWLFPAEKDLSKYIDVWVMSKYLRKAYELADLERQPGGLWHPFRRKWATERKDMPLRDVAAAGGWKDPTTLLKCYQQPDEATIRRVVLEAPKLRSRPDSTPTATPLLAGILDGASRKAV